MAPVRKGVGGRGWNGMGVAVMLRRVVGVMVEEVDGVANFADSCSAPKISCIFNECKEGYLL